MLRAKGLRLGILGMRATGLGDAVGVEHERFGGDGGGHIEGNGAAYFLDVIDMA